jgi:pentatricopeptide repeat protein
MWAGKEGIRAILWHEGVEPVPVNFVGVLNACASVAAALEEGKGIHEQTVKCGFESDVFVASSLIDMYAKYGSIEDAWTVCNMMPARDVVSWSTMILGYVKCGQDQKALDLFQQKGQHQSLSPL